MRLITAAMVTPADVQKFFTGHYKTKVREGGLIIAESKEYLVELQPKSPVFAVRIEAHEDPEDSDEVVTDDPDKFIMDFLKAGTGGDEVFGKMAGLVRRTDRLGPRDLSGLLRSIAARAASGQMTRRTAAMAVRRVSALMGRSAVRTADGMEAAELKEMAELQASMREKGWRSKVGYDDRDMPEMTVDVAGIYEARVSVHGLMWGFFFQVQGVSEASTEGVTDDPLEEFRGWRKSDEIQAVRSEQDAKKSGPKSPGPAPDDGKTEPSKGEPDMKTAPPPKKPVADEKTAPPPKKKPA